MATTILSPRRDLEVGSNTSHQVLALIGQVQVDLSAHQLGDFDLGVQVAGGVLLKGTPRRP